MATAEPAVTEAAGDKAKVKEAEQAATEAAVLAAEIAEAAAAEDAAAAEGAAAAGDVSSTYPQLLLQQLTVQLCLRRVEVTMTTTTLIRSAICGMSWLPAHAPRIAHVRIIAFCVNKSNDASGK